MNLHRPWSWFILLFFCLVYAPDVLQVSGAPTIKYDDEDSQKTDFDLSIYDIMDEIPMDMDTKKTNLTGGAACMSDDQCQSNNCVYSNNVLSNDLMFTHVQITYNSKKVKNYDISDKIDNSKKISNFFQKLGFNTPGYGFCAKECRTHAGYVGEGGVCSYDSQCGSGVCGDYKFAKFCSRECPVQGYVGAGGLCRTDSNCYSGVCEKIDFNSNTKVCSTDAPVMGKVGSAGRCRKDSDCYSKYCIPNDARNKWHGLCSTMAPKPGKIGGGGPCRNNSECYSDWCLPPRLEVGLRAYGEQPDVCAADSPIKGLIGEAGPCNKSTDCYSNLCVTDLKAGLKDKLISVGTPNIMEELGMDKFIGLSRSMPAHEMNTQNQTEIVGKAKGFCAKTSKLRGKIGQGGYCNKDSQCYSGICIRLGAKNVCAKDSPKMGKVGSGGPCFKNKHCFSNKCTRMKAQYNGLNATSKINLKRQARVCSADSQRYGKIGGGGLCQKSSSCFSRRCYKLIDSESGKKLGVCSAEAKKMKSDPKSKAEISSMKNVEDFIKAAEAMMKLSDLKGSKNKKLKKKIDRIYTMRNTNNTGSYMRKVADGAPCLRHKDCASGICQRYKQFRFCAKRSLRDQSLIGEGGYCKDDSQCASNFCACLGKLRKREDGREDDYKFCAKESDALGLVGGGGPCRSDLDCASEYCVMLIKTNETIDEVEGPYAYGFCSRDDSKYSGMVGHGGPCKRNSQCSSGRCGRLQLLDSESAPEFIRSMNNKQICLYNGGKQEWNVAFW